MPLLFVAHLVSFFFFFFFFHILTPAAYLKVGVVVLGGSKNGIRIHGVLHYVHGHDVGGKIIPLHYVLPPCINLVVNVNNFPKR